MKILLCIDDTDNIESIGTGEILENICAELEQRGKARGGFVTRHQLFICDRIAYTSHNSSMCCELETDDINAVIAFACDYLEHNCAEGSDPGLCVFKEDCPCDMESLMTFGARAKVEVLDKRSAYELAAQYQDIVHLSEHGGTGEGIIGALAGIGLRLGGDDGKIKGKLKPQQEGEILTVAEFCRRYAVDQVMSEDGTLASPEEMLRFDGMTKTFYRDHKITAIADKTDGFWIPKIKAAKAAKQDV